MTLDQYKISRTERRFEKKVTEIMCLAKLPDFTRFKKDVSNMDSSLEVDSMRERFFDKKKRLVDLLFKKYGLGDSKHFGTEDIPVLVKQIFNKYDTVLERRFAQLENKAIGRDVYQV